MHIDYIPAAATKTLTAEYAEVETPFGQAELATCDGAVVWLSFPQEGEAPQAKLRAFWRGELRPASNLQAVADELFTQPGNVKMMLGGTPFQHSVWEALAGMTSGETMSYGQLAVKIGRPKAVRAVGSAVGANPVVYAIPCHRILGSTGKLHGFGCGLPMKEKLLSVEGIKWMA